VEVVAPLFSAGRSSGGHATHTCSASRFVAHVAATYGARLQPLFSRRLRPRDDARDLAQEVYLAFSRIEPRLIREPLRYLTGSQAML